MTTAVALNLVALVAMLVARSGVAVSDRHSAVSDHLRALYGATAALMAFRLLATAVPATAPLVMVVAAWLPFLLLRLVEEMVRRHAPRSLKLLVLVGAIAFSVLALTLGLVWGGLAIGLLAAFHLLSVFGAIVLLLRDDARISLGERRAAILLAVALGSAILLATTDFQRLFPDLEVRGGPFAVLLLLLATSRLATGRGSVGYLMFDCLVTLLAGSLVYGLAVSQGWPGALSIAAVTTALTALAIAIERFVGLRAQENNLLGALARADRGRSDLLAAHPLLQQGRIVPESDFADYPEVERRLFEGQELISFDAADREGSDGAAMRDLLHRHAATHMIRLSPNPLTFLAISADGFAQDSLDDDLVIAARLIEAAT
ncbi:hypothetical protein SH584_10720 [Sphingomonas sp. LY29]|uniref:hypothetical protein n=1 Tax=Sphingomonas sp. LY29 TaxID=3095341 RepID=UPI002D78296A|nr:hypothetical protein [Sphingomonas sp. LY29]WRP25513.1 hypothetical protein SH584_10720 [Sphingomonas sp. LY29]